MRVSQHNSTLHANTERGLTRKTELRRAEFKRKPASNGRRFVPTLKQQKGISPASEAQREKVEDRRCIVCGVDPLVAKIDPAHLTARARGGCDDSMCVVALCRQCHNAFDGGRLSILEFLVGTWTEEVQHAVGHYDGDLIGLLQRLTNQRYEPVRES